MLQREKTHSNPLLDKLIPVWVLEAFSLVPTCHPSPGCQDFQCPTSWQRPGARLGFPGVVLRRASSAQAPVLLAKDIAPQTHSSGFPRLVSGKPD